MVAAEGLVRPVTQRRRGDRLSGPQGPAAACADAHWRRLRRLLLDCRGEGESEGDLSSWGWGGARDLDAAVAYLEAPPDVERWPDRRTGLSVGGEMMIEAAASTPGLRADALRALASLLARGA